MKLQCPSCGESSSFLLGTNVELDGKGRVCSYGYIAEIQYFCTSCGSIAEDIKEEAEDENRQLRP